MGKNAYTVSETFLMAPILPDPSVKRCNLHKELLGSSASVGKGKAVPVRS
jgi:hypothetical protein